VRCRPLIEAELAEGRCVSTVQISQDQKHLCIYDYKDLALVTDGELGAYFEDPNNFSASFFSFDKIYDQASS